MTELEEKILNLKKFLYMDYENSNIEKTSLKKALYELLRECLKVREYIINIGPYKININPQNLAVYYETETTTIEASNKDIYYETIRDLEIRYFVISPVRKDDFLLDTPIIVDKGFVMNINGRCEEQYYLDLESNDNDNIRNYVDIPKNVEILNGGIESKNEIAIKRVINLKSARTDVIDYLAKDKVIPVFLDTTVNKYITEPQRKEYIPNDYTMYLPKLEDKKSLVSFLYSSMVDLYEEVMNKK